MNSVQAKMVGLPAKMMALPAKIALRAIIVVFPVNIRLNGSTSNMWV